jgi:hypothetical protein
MKLPIVESEHPAERRVAQSNRAGDDRVEDRLDVGRRAADHPQDFGRRFFPFQALR